MSSKTTALSITEVKKHTRGVLLSQIGGVPLDQFENDYKQLVGQRFPYRTLGFSSARSCLESMTDTVRSEFCEVLQKHMLFGIGDEHSYMSSSAIKAQFTPDNPLAKQNRKKKKKFQPHRSSESDDSTQKHAFHKPSRQPNGPKHEANDQGSEPSELRANMKGLYGICVKRLPPGLEIEVMQLFSEVASPEEYRRGGSHFFLRYSSRSDAEDIMARFNNYKFHREKLSVSPATEKIGMKDRRQNRAKQEDGVSKENPNSDRIETKQGGDEQSFDFNGEMLSNKNTRKNDRTDKMAGKANRPQRTSNKSRISRPSPAKKQGTEDCKEPDKEDGSTPRLPWQKTPLQPNGDISRSPEEKTETSLKEDVIDKSKSSVTSHDVKPAIPSVDTSSISTISQRTIPKPRLPSILDLGDKLKTTKM